jgi:hypothetical protein
MNTVSMLAELRSERDRLNRAIVAIEGITSNGARRSGAPRRSTTQTRRKRRVHHLSAAGRRRLSELMKKRWAQGKMKPKGKS